MYAFKQVPSRISVCVHTEVKGMAKLYFALLLHYVLQSSALLIRRYNHSMSPAMTLHSGPNSTCNALQSFDLCLDSDVRMYMVQAFFRHDCGSVIGSKTLETCLKAKLF